MAKTLSYNKSKNRISQKQKILIYDLNTTKIHLKIKTICVTMSYQIANIETLYTRNYKAFL